jgi:regulatory protein
MEHKITRLTLQKRNHQRVNVYLDGEYAFGLSRIVAAWLQVGQEISDEKIEQLLAADAVEVAYRRALNFLSYRPRSESEVIKNLRKHNTDENIQREVINRLKNNGMINDRLFAQTWVENRCELRPRGARLLQYELRQRGVDQEIIDQTLEGLDEQELAYRAAKSKARKLRHSDQDTFRKKLFSFLSRRGFDYGTSAVIVTQVWNEMQNGQNHDLEIEIKRLNNER